MLIRTYKYKLYKTKKTNHIDNTINISGIIWNHCIALKKRYYKMYGKSLNMYQLQKHLTKLKKLEKYSYWKKVPSQAIQNITERIEESYKKFFKKQGGLPSFQKVKKYKSYTLKGKIGYKIENNVISLNGYKYKFWKSREIDGKIKTITVKRDNIGDFYICITLELEEPKYNITSGKSVGIDFGLKKFLTLSDDIDIEAPLFHLKNLKEIKRLNRELSRKKRNSNNRKKAKEKLAKLHIKIDNQRKDYQHKLSTSLANEYDYIFIENLNMNGMKKLWGRKISDLAFSQFVLMLEYKTNTHKIDRFYPSSKTCSRCENKNDSINETLEGLKDRIFVCGKCGFEIDRDLNASVNIHRVGASTLKLDTVIPSY